MRNLMLIIQGVLIVNEVCLSYIISSCDKVLTKIINKYFFIWQIKFCLNSFI